MRHIHDDPQQPFRRVLVALAAIATCAIWLSAEQDVGRAAGCMPGYSPCLPITSDLDCREISDAKKPVRVSGSDPYRLDADRDGLGCEAAGGASAPPQPVVGEFADFSTPSGNIRCAPSDWTSRSGRITCYLMSSWNQAKFYALAWHLPGVGAARVLKVTDAAGIGRVLLYGTTYRLGIFRCQSRFVGLKCWSTLSGHGFFMSRERQQIF